MRVVDPDWADPLDASFSRSGGGRWNPPGAFAALYLCRDVRDRASQRAAPARGSAVHVRRRASGAPARPRRDRRAPGSLRRRRELPRARVRRPAADLPPRRARAASSATSAARRSALRPGRRASPASPAAALRPTHRATARSSPSSTAGLRLRRSRRRRFDTLVPGRLTTITRVQATFGVLAGLLQLAASAPYIRDIVRGSTKPQRATWTIWTTLSFVVLASQWASGATWSLALTIGAGVLVRRDLPAGHPPRRGRCEPGRARAAGDCRARHRRLADLRRPGRRHLLRRGRGRHRRRPDAPEDLPRPGSETLATFAIGVVSTLFALAAVDSRDAALLIYPLYLLVADSAVVAVIFLRRRTLALT